MGTDLPTRRGENRYSREAQRLHELHQSAPGDFLRSLQLLREICGLSDGFDRCKGMFFGIKGSDAKSDSAADFRGVKLIVD